MENSRTPPPRTPAPPRENLRSAGGTFSHSEGGYVPGMNVIQPNSTPDHGAQKLAQLWLWGIALLAIWGGLFTIAFSQGDSNNRFALLGLGGIISAAIFVSMVEIQRRKHDVLTEMHDYTLGMGFFFAAIGFLWGMRYISALISSFGIDLFVDPSRPFTSMDSIGWSPNANAIYLQTVGALILAAGQWYYLRHLLNDGRNKTTVSWFVVALTPFALLLVGIGPWINWSNGFISIEIGISLILLCALAMMLAIESDRSIIFMICAVSSSIITIIYEMSNEANINGSSITLLNVIIIIQGLLASTDKLNRTLVEKSSLALMGSALIAMFYSQMADMTLFLGPLTFADDHNWLTLPSMLWMCILIGYFPATLRNRIPWMPIGLAGALILMPAPANMIPWLLTMVMIPYMLWNERTRPWVANWTFGVLSITFFIVSWMTYGHETHDANVWGWFPQHYDLIIGIGLILTGEIASRSGRLNRSVGRMAIAAIVASPATLIGEDTLMPWIVAIYLLGTVILEQLQFDEEEGLDARKNLSITIASSLIFTALLAALGRLSLDGTPLASLNDSLAGFNLVIALIAVAYFTIGARTNKHELDFGHLVGLGLSQGASVPLYNPETATWETNEENPDAPSWLEKGWGSVARISFLGPLMLFSIAIASVSTSSLHDNPIWILLLILPISMIVREVLSSTGHGATERAVGTWALFALAVPINMQLLSEYELLDYSTNSGMGLSNVLFDLILIMGPLFTHFLLLKKGIDDEADNYTRANNATLIGLLALTLLDATGGLVITTMFFLVLWRAVMHRRSIVIYLLPFVWIFLPNGNDGADLFFNEIIPALGGLADYFLIDESTVYDDNKIVGLMWTIFALTIFSKSVVDKRLNDETIRKMPFILPSFFLIAGLAMLLDSPDWLLVIVTTIIITFGWLLGRMEGFPIAPFTYFIGFIIGLDSTVSGFELFSLAALYTGLVTFAMWGLASQNILFKWCAPVQNSDANTIQIATTSNGIQTNIDWAKKNRLNSIFFGESDVAREKLTSFLKYTGMVFLLLSLDEMHGLSTVVVAIWWTIDSWKNQNANTLLFTPVLHAIALWNVERLTDSLSGMDLPGWLLIVEGIILSRVSASQWYPNWNWNEDGSDFWKWNDQMGILAVCYVGVGIIWAVYDLSVTGTGILIIGYGMVQAALDFNRQWRRISSIAATSIGTFIIAFMSDITGTYQGLAMIFGGIAAFGQAAFYFKLWGEEENTVKSGDAVTIGESIEGKVMAMPAGMSEGESSSELSDEEEDEEATEMIDNTTSEVEEEVDSPETPSTEGETEAVEEKGASEEAEVSSTQNDEFEIRLPEDILANIRATLAMTEHSGFKPIVSFDQYGQIVLHYEML